MADTYEEYLRELAKTDPIRADVLSFKHKLELDAYAAVLDPEQNEQRFVFGALLIAAGIFYTGYRVGNAADSIADSVKRMNETFQVVAAKLVEVLDKLSEILDVLLKLPAAIQGVIEAVEFRKNLTLALVRLGQLKDWSISEQLWRDRVASGEVEDYLRQIRENIALCWTFGGMSGYVQSAALTAAWSQSYQNLQKLKPTLPCVWDTSFTKDFIRDLHVAPLMERTTAILREAEQQSLTTICDDRIYRYINGGFMRTARPITPTIPFGESLSCYCYLEGPSGFTLCGYLGNIASGVARRTPLLCYGGSPSYEVCRLASNQRQESIRISNILRQLSGFDEVRTKTMEAFVKPVDWQGVCP